VSPGRCARRRSPRSRRENGAFATSEALS